MLISSGIGPGCPFGMDRIYTHEGMVVRPSQHEQPQRCMFPFKLYHDATTQNYVGNTVQPAPIDQVSKMGPISPMDSIFLQVCAHADLYWE